MASPSLLQSLRLPIIGAPMFTVSYPELVIAQCRAGIVGAFPALNAREEGALETWLTRISAETAAAATADAGASAAAPTPAAAPFAVNLIIHRSNARQERDARLCIDHRVKILITSLGAPPREWVDAVHGYGGIVLHDVIHQRHAEKALHAGVDGLIAVASGAGGHAGRLSPFALVAALRPMFDGPLALAGAIADGGAVAAARALGADLAYMGTRFIATEEAQASPAYKQALIDADADDIVYTDRITGVHGNYLAASLTRAGIDLENDLPGARPGLEGLSATQSGAKAWKDIWGAGQGVAAMRDCPSVAALVARLETEYRQAIGRLAG